MALTLTAGQNDRVKNGPPTYGHVDFGTTAGVAQTVLPAIAGKQIFVHSMILSYADSGTIRFQEGTSTNRVLNHEFKDVDQPSIQLGGPKGLFLLAEGESLDIIHFAGGQVRIQLVFDYLPAES